mmetsp:Transcript_43848/g.137760  ORF Transcript_43848/g.137760 Transcript_43848/m.137760 type:complete len:232 (-) Transcript_43848:856-1551(-)
MFKFVTIAAAVAGASAFTAPARRAARTQLRMSSVESTASLNDINAPTVEEFLADTDPKLKSTMLAMFTACKEIAYKVRTASCDKMACFNEFGDEQLAIDILANTVIFENLKASGTCATASSEETPVSLVYHRSRSASIFRFVYAGAGGSRRGRLEVGRTRDPTRQRYCWQPDAATSSHRGLPRLQRPSPSPSLFPTPNPSIPQCAVGGGPHGRRGLLRCLRPARRQLHHRH